MIERVFSTIWLLPVEQLVCAVCEAHTCLQVKNITMKKYGNGWAHGWIKFRSHSNDKLDGILIFWFPHGKWEIIWIEEKKYSSKRGTHDHS